MMSMCRQFGRELAAQGEAAMLSFARDWLGSSEQVISNRRTAATIGTATLMFAAAFLPRRREGRVRGASQQPLGAPLVRRRSRARDFVGDGRRRLAFRRAAAEAVCAIGVS